MMTTPLYKVDTVYIFDMAYLTGRSANKYVTYVSDLTGSSVCVRV